MEKEIKDLLENEVLGEDVRAALQEAFDNKIKLLEQKLQEDYAARYDNDKAVLVEAMGKMLDDSIRSELSEFAVDRSAMITQRAKLSRSVAESKKAYVAKMSEHIKLLNEFMARTIKQEIVEFQSDRKNLVKQRQQMAGELQSVKESNSRELKARISKLEGFVLKQLSEEMAEFHADKTALVEQRVKLANEGKRKIAEAQSKFITRASTAVDKTLNEVIRSELSQWRDDIKVARENNFGRRIFESVAAEYMASYLSEGSEVKSLTRKLQEQEAALVEARDALQEKSSLVEAANKQANAATSRLQRFTVLNELLAPLDRGKKAVMAEMLKDIKTTHLKEAFTRYLPTVVNGNNVSSKATLSETKQNKPVSVAVTGDRTNTLTKAVLEETQQSNDLGEILHLAGIKK
jgi:hypothetical protein